MPIIPVLTPESDYSPPRMAVPDVNDLPAAKTARLAAGVSELAQVAGSAVSNYQDIQGQIEAQKACGTDQIDRGELEERESDENAGAAPFGAEHLLDEAVQEVEVGDSERKPHLLKNAFDLIQRLPSKILGL